mgnify:CR=1 FL=1
MGQEEVPGHVEAGGDGRAEQEGGGLEQGGAEAASINLRKNLDGTGSFLVIWVIVDGIDDGLVARSEGIDGLALSDQAVDKGSE